MNEKGWVMTICSFKRWICYNGLSELLLNTGIISYHILEFLYPSWTILSGDQTINHQHYINSGNSLQSTLRILVTVGSALSMRPGLGWMFAFSAVFSLGANSLSSVLNQICNGRGTGREGQSRNRDGVEGLGRNMVYCVNMVNKISSVITSTKKSSENRCHTCSLWDGSAYRLEVRQVVFESDSRPSLLHSCRSMPRQSQLCKEAQEKQWGSCYWLTEYLAGFLTENILKWDYRLWKWSEQDFGALTCISDLLCPIVAWA